MMSAHLRRCRLLPPVCAAILMVAPVVRASEETPGTCPEPQVRIMEDSRSTATTLPLPATPVSYALPRQSDGTRRIMLLMVPEHARTGSDVVRDRVRQALAAGEFETLFAGQDTIEMGDGRLDIRVKKKSSGNTPYTDAIRAGLAETGIKLDPGTGGDFPCPAMPPVAGPALYRLQPRAEPPWEWVQDLRAGGATALGALDLDGDGRDELLLESEGQLFQIQAGTDGRYAEPPTLLFADPDLRLRADEPREVRFPPEPVAVRSPLDGDSHVGDLGDQQGPAHADLAGRLNPLHMRVTSLGLLKFYGPGTNGGNWRLQSQVSLPTRSLPKDSMLLLAAPEVRTVGRNSQGHPILAAGPVPYGDQRLLTTVIELDTLESPRIQEVWSRLSRDEVVDESGFMVLDGEPFLWVKTDNESEVEIFGDNTALRIFPLTQEPSRAGVQPVLRFNKVNDLLETRMKYGQDVDGDGLDDLLFIGRDEDGLLIGSYLQARDGKFKRSMSRQRLAADEKPLSYGVDLDGDNLPDLVTSTGQEVRIHAGVPPSAEGKKLTLVSAQASWIASLSTPEISAVAKKPGESRQSDNGVQSVDCRGLPVFSDLDGDGRSERVCTGVDGYGRPFFKILKFNPAPAAQGGPADHAPAATGR